MLKHCVITTQGFVGLLLSDHKWFKTTKKRLHDRYDQLVPVDHRGVWIREGYFVCQASKGWLIDEHYFPEVSEVIELEDSDDIYVTTYSSEAALRYKLMLG